MRSPDVDNRHAAALPARRHRAMQEGNLPDVRAGPRWIHLPPTQDTEQFSKDVRSSPPQQQPDERRCRASLPMRMNSISRTSLGTRIHTAVADSAIPAKATRTPPKVEMMV